MKAAAIVCLVGLTALCPGKGQAGTHAAVSSRPPASVCGHWIVKKVIPTIGVSAAPRKDFIGMKAEYLPSEMRFGSLVTVRRSFYRVRKWSRRKFFTEFHNHVAELGVKGESVLLVDVVDEHGNDIIRPGAGLIIRNDHQIISDWNGVYYLLEREGAPCPGAAPDAKK